MSNMFQNRRDNVKPHITKMDCVYLTAITNLLLHITDVAPHS